MDNLFRLTMTRITSEVVQGQLVVRHEQEDLLVESTGCEVVRRNACALPHAGKVQASWTRLQTPFTAEQRVSDREGVVCVVHAVVPWEEFVSAREERLKRRYTEDTDEGSPPKRRPTTPIEDETPVYGSWEEFARAREERTRLGEERPQSPVYRSTGQ
jgi:hypothetical protein